jgi:hypothetical protein
MANLIYALCALTSATCLALLWRSYVATHSRLLFWSAWCFLLLTANNVLLVFDKIVFPVEVDLRMWRLGTSLAAVLLLLYGLVNEED